LDIYDSDTFTSDLKPIGAISRPDKKQKIGRPSRQERTTADIAAMRMEAWKRQRLAQRERSRGGGGAWIVLEDITAATDMELAANGFPFSLKLERNGDHFVWILIHESRARLGQTAAKSRSLALSDISAKSVGALLKEFLNVNIGGYR